MPETTQGPLKAAKQAIKTITSVAKSAIQRIAQAPQRGGVTDILRSPEHLTAGLINILTAGRLPTYYSSGKIAMQAPPVKAEEAIKPLQFIEVLRGMSSRELFPTPAAQPPSTSISISPQTSVPHTSSSGATTMVPTTTISRIVEQRKPTSAPTSTTLSGGMSLPPSREVGIPTQIAGIPVEAIRQMIAEREVPTGTIWIPEGLPLAERPRRLTEEELRKIRLRTGRG